MKKNLVVSVMSILAFQSYAQDAVSGYIETSGNEKQEMVLSLIELQDGEEVKRIIATAPVQENGSFTFPANLFNQQDRVYQIHIKTPEPEINEADRPIREFKSFILSNRDKLHFAHGIDSGLSYSTTNNADKEWRKLKEYDERMRIKNQGHTDDYLTQTRNYTKDSLEILLVKLLSIKSLDEKKLLDKDIEENADFYLDLLEQLRDSNLEPSYYAYLENKISTTHQDIIQQKYHFSLFFNFLGIGMILMLLYTVFRLRKRPSENPVALLSKQEENVKNLILQGKTNKEIAAELFISISTVKTHTSNIYSKLNVSNRKDLVLKY